MDDLKSVLLNFVVKQKIEIFATQVYVLALLSLAIFLLRTVQYLICTLQLFVIEALRVKKPYQERLPLFSDKPEVSQG